MFLPRTMPLIYSSGNWTNVPEGVYQGFQDLKAVDPRSREVFTTVTAKVEGFNSTTAWICSSHNPDQPNPSNCVLDGGQLNKPCSGQNHIESSMISVNFQATFYIGFFTLQNGAWCSIANMGGGAMSVLNGGQASIVSCIFRNNQGVL